MRSVRALSPGDEALELRDFGSPVLVPTLTPEPLGSLLTWDDVERMAAQRQATPPAGWRDAVCVACTCALYVPVGQAGDVLCPACKRDGEALAAAEDSGSDDDPDRPGGAAMHAEYAAELAAWSDPDLLTAIGIVSDGRDRHWFTNDAERHAWLDAATAEILRRLEPATTPRAPIAAAA